MKTKESDHTHAAGATDRPRAIAKGALSIFDPPVPCHVLADRAPEQLTLTAARPRGAIRDDRI